MAWSSASLISPASAIWASCSASSFASADSPSAICCSSAANSSDRFACIAAASPLSRAWAAASSPAFRRASAISCIASPAVFCRSSSSRCSALSSATSASTESRLSSSSRFSSSVSFRSSAFSFSVRPFSSAASASSICFAMTAVFSRSACRSATIRSPSPGIPSVPAHSTASAAPVISSRFGIGSRICRTSSARRCSTASCRWRRTGGRSFSFSSRSPSSSAVTTRSFSPQASAARAASIFLTLRSAFTAAPARIPPATMIPAIHHLFSSGTKAVTASSTRAAAAPAAKPAAAPVIPRPSRILLFTGASARSSSFIRTVLSLVVSF